MHAYRKVTLLSQQGYGTKGKEDAGGSLRCPVRFHAFIASANEFSSQLTDDGRRDYRELVKGHGWEESRARASPDMCTAPS